MKIRSRFAARFAARFAPRRGALALVLGMIVVAAGLAGCGGAAGQPDPLTVASVNGHAISLSDYQTVLAVLKASAAAQGQGLDWQNATGRANLTSTEQQSLDMLVTTEISREQLKKPVTSAEMKTARAQFTQIKTSYAKAQDPSARALADALTPRAIELFAEQAAIQQALVAQISVPSYHARGMILKTLADAQNYEQQAAKGSDFGQLAHDHSLDTSSASQNGDLGTIYPGFTQESATLDKMVFAKGAHLEDGKYVIFPYGGNYVLLELTQPGQTLISKISDPQTQQNAFNGWLNDLVRPLASVQQNILLG